MARIQVGTTDTSKAAAQARQMPNSAVFMILLVCAEYAAFLALRYFFRTVHGG